MLNLEMSTFPDWTFRSVNYEVHAIASSANYEVHAIVLLRFTTFFVFLLLFTTSLKTTKIHNNEPWRTVSYGFPGFPGPPGSVLRTFRESEKVR